MKPSTPIIFLLCIVSFVAGEVDCAHRVSKRLIPVTDDAVPTAATASLNEAALLHAIAEVESGDNYDVQDYNRHFGKYQVSEDVIQQYASANNVWAIPFSADHGYQDVIALWWLHRLEATHSTQDQAALYRLWNSNASADTVQRVLNLYQKFNQ